MIVVPTAPGAHLVFDALAWSSGLAVSVALYRWRLRGAVERAAVRTGPGYFTCLTIGAAISAWAAGSLNTLRDTDPALSHSVAGALTGAIIGVEAYKAARGIRGSTGGVFVGSFTAGVVVGRWGCLFAGLPDRTYGTPTGLPWGVDLGDGVSRHPVQVYESLAMSAFLALYVLALHRRQPWASRRSFYAMCAAYGLQRFVWEFLKPYPTLFGPLNVFHLLCAGLVTYGCIYAARDRHDEQRARRRALPVPGPDHEPV